MQNISLNKSNAMRKFSNFQKNYIFVCVQGSTRKVQVATQSQNQQGFNYQLEP